MDLTVTDEGVCFNWNNYVVQSNQFVLSKQTFGVKGTKLIRFLIMQIMRDDTEFEEFHISSSKLSEIIDSTKANIHRDAISMVNELRDNSQITLIPMDEEDEGVGCVWLLKSIFYSKKTGLTVRLNDDLKPYLLQLYGNYTQYRFSNIRKMKSIYSIRIYELVSSLVNFKKRENKVVISFDKLRSCCNCDDDYTRVSNFKSRVIDRAISEIKEKTDLDIEAKIIRKGHTATDIEFTVSKKSGAEDALPG